MIRLFTLFEPTVRNYDKITSETAELRLQQSGCEGSHPAARVPADVAMRFVVMRFAEPAYHKRLIVVVVMRFDSVTLID